MGRTNVIPNRKIGDPERLNWGKFMQLGRGVRHIQAFQKRFEDWSTHDFVERPFIKAMLDNSPVLEEDVSLLVQLVFIYLMIDLSDLALLFLRSNIVVADLWFPRMVARIQPPRR